MLFTCLPTPVGIHLYKPKGKEKKKRAIQQHFSALSALCPVVWPPHLICTDCSNVSASKASNFMLTSPSVPSHRMPIWNINHYNSLKCFRWRKCALSFSLPLALSLFVSNEQWLRLSHIAGGNRQCRAITSGISMLNVWPENSLFSQRMNISPNVTLLIWG